jgi:concentrative nucleoside transporter, CNT family
MEWGLDNARAIGGALLIIAFCWALSENRKVFPWRLAFGAMAVQALLVILLFGVPASQGFLNGVNGAVDGLAKATAEGTKFVFGYLGGGNSPFMPADAKAPPPFVFAFQVLPLILVISALAGLRLWLQRRTSLWAWWKARL